MLLKHIKKASDLVTSKEAITAGFILQAREKVSLAIPHIRDAISLGKELEATTDLMEAMKSAKIRDGLLAAVGLSTKALGHLDSDDQERILKEVLSEIEQQAGGRWRSDLVLRFALTRGDSLGGSSRNVAGVSAKNLFADAVVQSLISKNITHNIVRSKKGKRKVQSLSWADRIVIFDNLPKIVGKNIDVIVLEDDHVNPLRGLLEEKGAYIACGEVKGGIDPAGADEHWKTANSALERVRYSFGLQRPALFLAGAAIVDSMAAEIISQLRDNRLTFAANLTKPEQVADLADWLVSL